MQSSYNTTIDMVKVIVHWHENTIILSKNSWKKNVCFGRKKTENNHVNACIWNRLITFSIVNYPPSSLKNYRLFTILENYLCKISKAVLRNLPQEKKMKKLMEPLPKNKRLLSWKIILINSLKFISKYVSIKWCLSLNFFSMLHLAFWKT